MEDYLFTTTYTVTWISERDPSNVQSATLTEQSSCTITGLTLDTVYTISVTAANDCGSGPAIMTDTIISTGTYVLVYVRLYVYMYVCTFVCMYVCTYVHLYACMYYAHPLFTSMYHIPPTITAIINPVQSTKYTRTKPVQTHVSTRYNLF